MLKKNICKCIEVNRIYEGDDNDKLFECPSRFKNRKLKMNYWKNIQIWILISNQIIFPEQQKEFIEMDMIK